MAQDYYQILALSRNATEAEINKAYRQQLRLWRNRTNAPDLERRQEAERILQELEAAKKVLLDPQARIAYERLLPTNTHQTTNPNSTAKPKETKSPIVVNRAIEALERRYYQNPTDDDLKLELAWEYCNSSCQNWTYVPSEKLFYPTEKSHVEEAQTYIEKAEALNCADSRLAGEIRETKNSIAHCLQRQFMGSHAVAIIGGFVCTGIFELGLFLIPAYYIAYRTPQYLINRQVIFNSRTWEQKFLQSHKTPLLSILAVVFMPPLVYLALIVSAFLRNYRDFSFSFGKDSQFIQKIEQYLSNLKQKINSK